MTDELAFDAFPFDFDFTDSFPVGDFDLSNDPGLPNPLQWFHDLFAGAGELGGMIARAFFGLWENIWAGIGGTVRWVWNMVDDAINWSKTVLSIAITNVGDAVSLWFPWVWEQAGRAWGPFGSGISGGLQWLDAGLDWLEENVPQAIKDWAEWTWDKAGKVWGGFGSGISGGLQWLDLGIDWIQEHVPQAIADWATWGWEQAGKVWGGFGRGISGGLQWLDAGIDWIQEYVPIHIRDWTKWTWELAADAGGAFTGGIGGGFHYVTNTLLPNIIGVGADIVGGLAAGFESLGDILMKPFELLGGLIADAIKWPFVTAFEPIKDTFAHKLAIPGKMVRGEYGSVQELVDDISDPPIIDNIVMAFGWAIVGIFSLVVALLPALRPINEKLIQDANQDFRPRLLSEDAILDAELRGIPVAEGYDTQLERWGNKDVDKAALRALRQLIPGSGDLVRFAVREAFDRSKAEALGFITPLPGDFSLWMERQGFSTEWSERFWWAHWDLPSVTQGFEMLHREVIAPGDLEGLLIALDIPPKWIPRLLDISYNVITRVDIRRLYQDGIVDEDEVERTYRHMGYSPDDARKITDMVKIRYAPGGKDEGPDLRDLTISTIKQAYVRRLIDRDEALEKLLAVKFPEEDAELVLSLWDFDLAWNPSLRFEVPFKDLSRSVITDAYRRGVFDFNRAAVELVEAGYTQDDAELLLQLEDLKLQQELTDMEIDLVLQDARAQDITLAEAETRLLGLGIEPARVTFLVRREELRRMTKTRTLTVSQIARAYRAGLFTEGVFLQKVEALAYTADDAAVLLGLEGPVEQAKRQLSRSEVERLLRRQEITHDAALGRLTAMGYLPEDAELIVGSVERQLERGLVERLLEQALLTRAEALGRLVKVGFSSADAELIVRSREQKMAEEAEKAIPEETPSRELSRTLVEKFLREGLLDREQALDRLVRAGFTRGDAELIILSVERKLAEEALEA